MANIIVLGAGMVGSAIAIDLSQKHTVTCADLNCDTLNQLSKKNSSITTIKLDVTNEEFLQSTIGPYDLVINAVPGFLGFNTLKQIIEAKKNVVDISFCPENSLDLHNLAIENGVTAIVDCGVAPGMDNVILGHYNEQMKITDFECLVGGLPKVKKWPFYYKAPFSPIDVIEEYTRPARYVENGQMVIKPALSDVEHVEFEKVGTLEAFNSDGLRSIIFSMPHIPNMKEKTLRYPGHAEKISVLRDAGFFDTKPISISGNLVKPIDYTAKLLFKEWKLGENEEEFTVMRVSITGKDKSGIRKKIEYNLYDEYDASSNTSSMARTTGYTATAITNLLLEGFFVKKGVFPPELVGKHDACFHYIMDYLKERNINYVKSESIIGQG